MFEMFGVLAVKLRKPIEFTRTVSYRKLNNCHKRIREKTGTSNAEHKSAFEIRYENNLKSYENKNSSAINLFVRLEYSVIFGNFQPIFDMY